MKVTIVVGNPRPGSRTRKIAELFVDRMLGDPHDLQIIDLADHMYTVFDPNSARLEELKTRVARSDIVVVASPTYKATFTGLLKTFLDNYEANGLDGVVVFPLMTGADRIHGLGLDVHLIPLLLELGAIVPDRGHYFVISETYELDPEIERAALRANQRLKRLERIATLIGRA